MRHNPVDHVPTIQDAPIGKQDKLIATFVKQPSPPRWFLIFNFRRNLPALLEHCPIAKMSARVRQTISIRLGSTDRCAIDHQAAIE